MQIFLDLAAIQSYSCDLVKRVFKVLKLGHFKNYLMENRKNGNGKTMPGMVKNKLAKTAFFLQNSYF